MNPILIKHLTIRIKGISKLIMHNGRLADSSDPITIAREEAQKAHKKNPTAQNWESFAQLMQQGGLYFSEEMGAYIPFDNLQAMLIKAGASIIKKGQKTYKSAASTLNFECDYGFPVLVDGKPVTSFKSLIEDKKWRFERLVVIGRNRVRSVRPVFPTGWQCDIKISYMPTLIEADNIREIFDIAGLEVGLGDWRPSAPKPGPFGRFLVETFTEEK